MPELSPDGGGTMNPTGDDEAPPEVASLAERWRAQSAKDVASLTPEDLERGEQIMADVERHMRLRHAAEAAGVISLGKERVMRRRRAHLRRSGRPPE